MKFGQIAKLNLSGEEIKVGTDRSEFPWIQTSENSEPIYMQVTEAKLLIVALQVAVEECADGS